MVKFVDGRPSPNLQRLQEVQQDLAARLVDYCNANDLEIFLVAGSALGAARDGGMIAWDDDIDLGMLRPDYEKLITRLTQEPMPGVFLQCSRTEPDFPYTFIKLRLDGTKIEEYLSLGDKFNNGIFVDIFPYDAVPDSAVFKKLLILILKVCDFFVLSFNRQLALGATRPLFRHLRLLALALRPVLPISLVARLRERALKWAWNGKWQRLASYHMYSLHDAKRTETTLATLVPPRLMKFGQRQMPVPADCETYLTGLFGDYRQLPPVELRVPGHIRHVEFGVASSCPPGRA